MLKRIIKLIIAGGILSALFYYVNIETVISLLAEANSFLLFLGIVFFIASQFINPINIGLLLRPLGHNLSYKMLFKTWSMSFSLGLLTPGKVGEFSIMYFLNKYDVSYLKGFVASLIDKMLSLIILVLITIFGLPFYLGELYVYVSLFFFLMGILLFFYILQTKKMKILIKKVAPNRIHQEIEKVIESMNTVYNNPKYLLVNIGLSFLKWSMLLFGVYLFFLSFGQTPFFPVITSIYAFSLILGLIPISIAGIGIREGSFVYLAEVFTTATRDAAFNAAMLLLLLKYLFALICYGYNNDLIE